MGSYAGSPSPYRTFDQGGNVWEWNETATGASRGLRGGSRGLGIGAGFVAASFPGVPSNPAGEGDDSGFRVARLVPETVQVLIVLTGGLVLAATRRQRRA